MTGLTPQLIALFATLGAGLWMATAGVQKQALEWKRRRRICPSCGHEIAGRVCGRH
jgi:NADH pyrophosphatase NudC (nudix superfamily)